MLYYFANEMSYCHAEPFTAFEGRLREASHEIFYSSPGSTPAQDDILGRVNPKTVLYDALNKMQDTRYKDKECPSES